MSVERRRGTNVDARMEAGESADDCGQIALEMKTEREKVRHHDDARGAFLHECRNSGFEIGCATAEERDFYKIESSFALHGLRDTAHSLVGGFNRGAVSKDDNGSRGHRGMFRVSQMLKVGKAARTLGKY